jgi:uncharacterized membrane protein
MLTGFFTRPLLIAMGLSFLVSSFGYIIFRLWLGPILRYTNTKRKIRANLTPEKMTKDRAGRVRHLADTLTSVYHNALPYWYRLLLTRREEDPIRAATFLMKLANTRDPDHAARQTDEIQRCLKL